MYTVALLILLTHRQLITALAATSLTSQATSASNSTDNPILDQAQVVSCTYERPKLCAPRGPCCRISEFCLAGTTCEPCLPAVIRSLPRERQLTWCRGHGQRNVSVMASDTCRLACHDVFTPEEMIDVKEKSPPSVSEDAKVEKCVDQDLTLSIIALTLSSLAVFLLLVIGSVILIYECIKRRKKSNATKRKITQDIEVTSKRKITQDIEVSESCKLKNTLSKESASNDVEETNIEETNTRPASVSNSGAGKKLLKNAPTAQRSTDDEPGPSTQLLNTRPASGSDSDAGKKSSKNVPTAQRSTDDEPGPSTQLLNTTPASGSDSDAGKKPSKNVPTLAQRSTDDEPGPSTQLLNTRPALGCDSDTGKKSSKNVPTAQRSTDDEPESSTQLL